MPKNNAKCLQKIEMTEEFCKLMFKLMFLSKITQEHYKITLYLSKITQNCPKMPKEMVGNASRRPKIVHVN